MDTSEIFLRGSRLRAVDARNPGSRKATKQPSRRNPTNLAAVEFSAIDRGKRETRKREFTWGAYLIVNFTLTIRDRLNIYYLLLLFVVQFVGVSLMLTINGKSLLKSQILLTPCA